jgi:hypothetical protein
MYLDQSLGLEGRGQFWGVCAGHQCEEEALYRCRDCCFKYGYCKDCIKRQHRNLPLHVLEVRNWTLLLGQSNVVPLGVEEEPFPSSNSFRAWDAVPARSLSRRKLSYLQATSWGIYSSSYELCSFCQHPFLCLCEA